jgi:hypothetical protein
MVYLFIAIFLGWFSFYFDFLNKKQGKSFPYILSWIMLVLLAGLRYKVGGDTYNYMYEFANSGSNFNFFLLNSSPNQRQPGWNLLVSISKLIADNFTSLQIILALIVNTTFFWFIKKHTKYYFTGIFIYYLFFYCYFNFEILRESLAVCSLMLAFNSLVNGKYKLYYLFVAIALLFHISAIFLIFFPLLYKMAKRIQLKFPGRKLILGVSMIAILIFIFGIFFTSFFQKILPPFIFNAILKSKIVQYNEYNFTVFGIISSLFYYVLVPLFFIQRLRKQYYTKELLSIMIIYVLVGSSITFYSIFFRFLNYLIPFYILVITESLLYLYNKDSNYNLNLGKVFFVFIFIFIIFTNKYFSRVKEVPSIRWYSHWYPYHSIFDKIEDPKRKKLADYQLNFK